MTDRENSSSKPFQLMLILASFVIVVAGMKAAESIIVPFLLSVFISIIALPPFYWLQQKRIPRGFALIIIILLFLAFIFLIGLLIGTSVNDFSSRLPTYELKLQNQTQELIDWLIKKEFIEPDFQISNAFNPGEVFTLVGDVFNMNKYITLKSIMNLCNALLVTIFLFLMGVDYFLPEETE